MKTHYYLQPHCGSIPEPLRHWYGITLKDAENIACGVCVGQMAAGRKRCAVRIFEIPDDARGIDERAKLLNIVQL